MQTNFEDEDSSKVESVLINRFEKTVKGSLTYFLILCIIKQYGSIYGLRIKKILKEITNADSYIQDSSLYTILRHLEKNQRLLTSEMRERRRYYSLTEEGVKETVQGRNYWFKLIETSIEALNALDLVPKKINEEEI